MAIERLDYFPLGLAQDEAFCNRTSERAHLTHNMQTQKPTLLISPRRYGKTSLAVQALRDGDVPFAMIDFFVSPDSDSISAHVLNGVAELMTNIMKSSEKALKFAKEVFKNLEVSIDLGRLKLQLHPGSAAQQNPSLLIFDTLKQLEEALTKQKQKAALFFDEFQVLGQLKDSQGIEGAIRNVAQQSKSLSFLFSGSSRHLLSTMFDDRNRPLYLLCDRIHVTRIHSPEYLAFFDKAAQATWKKALPRETGEAILTLTAHHPYYVNVLCSRLFLKAELPTSMDAETTWHQYAQQERSRIAYDLNQLSVNQRKLLLALSSEAVGSITSQKFLQQHGLSGASSLQAMNVLVERDYVYQNDEGLFHILDPVLQYVLEYL